MGKVKNLQEKRIEESAGHYLSDQPEGTLYGAYQELKDVQEEGNGTACANNYVVVWQPLENMSVDEIVDLIEAGIDDEEPEVPAFIQNIDWSELRNQKRTLLETIEFIRNEDKFDPQVDTEEIINNLTGILHTIDAIQDYAVDIMDISAIHIFDFELEEERDNDTPEQAFARKCAELIFDELCESDGFHQDDDMPEIFIETTMADRYQADIIKAKLREQILSDLKGKPMEFTWTDTVAVYDGNMREDYEGLVTAYIRELFDKNNKSL